MLRSLREHPRLGKPRDDLFPGCRSLPIEQHVIFYHQLEENEIEIVRILHRRQDASGEVEAPAS